MNDGTPLTPKLAACAVYTLGSYAPKGHTTELQQSQEWRSVALDKGM